MVLWCEGKRVLWDQSWEQASWSKSRKHGLNFPTMSTEKWSSQWTVEASFFRPQWCVRRHLSRAETTSKYTVAARLWPPIESFSGTSRTGCACWRWCVPRQKGSLLSPSEWRRGKDMLPCPSLKKNQPPWSLWEVDSWPVSIPLWRPPGCWLKFFCGRK